MKDILNTISDKSDAAETNLWYSIEEQIKEDNLMRKRKNRRFRFGLTWLAALLGLIIVGTVSYGRNMQRLYHPVTLAEIEAMATPLNLVESRDDITIYLDWAYLDRTGIVIAYSAVDAEGNALTGNALRGTVELHVMWDRNQYSGMVREIFSANPDATQQVKRFDFSPDYFEWINEWTDGEIDLLSDPAIRFRLYFFPETDASLHASLLFNFELPYRNATFEHHNHFVDVRSTWETAPEPIDELDVYFNDIIIADSTTMTSVCIQFPDDAPIGWYFPTEVNLFVDNRRVNAVPSHMLQDGENHNRYANAIEVEYEIGYNSEDNWASCGSYIWHMAFDEMPETVRIEIPGLRSSQVPYQFDNEAQMQGYIDLFAEEGYRISPPESGALTIRDIHFDDAWHDLNPAERYHIELRLMDKFFAQFPPDAQYTEGWEYTFEIYEMPTDPPPASYHEVSVQEIERQSTSVGRRFTQDLLNAQDNFMMEVDWAYADANQIVMAISAYDLEGNMLTGDEFPDGSVELWQVAPELNEVNNIEFTRQWRFGREPLVTSPESGQQILRFPVPSDFLESDITALLGELDLQLEAVFLIPTISDLYAEYPLRFDAPFEVASYEQHNTDFPMPGQITSRDEPITELEVYFNDLVISDTATSVEVCSYLPDDSPETFYYAGEVNLYMDGRPVAVEPESIGIDWLVNEYQVVEREFRFSPNLVNRSGQCGRYMWHIDFDIMPGSLRIEIPAIYRDISYDESEETRETYFELMADAGYESAQEEQIITTFSESWLDSLAQNAINRSIREAFNEIYPPEVAYDAGWDYTFNISE